MDTSEVMACRFFERIKERDKVGVWGFGNVSRDVVLTLAYEDLGKEVVFYSRAKEPFMHRAEAWINDFKANAISRPRLKGTSDTADMAGLDVIFIGVGVPRKKGMTRDDLLAVNTSVIAQTTLEIKKLYSGCNEDDLPILVYMGNPVTAMTWVGWKASGFPKEKILGQAGNLDSRRICQAISGVLGLSGRDVQGIVFGDHADSMVASQSFFSVAGIPLPEYLAVEGIDPAEIEEVIQLAKQGGTHFVNEVGQSASAGPARAACEMLRTAIKGEAEVQPVICILEEEYGLVKPEDAIRSMAFGVPARIGGHGVEKIVELDITAIRDEMEASAATIKENISIAAKTLKEKFGIE